MYHGGLFIHKKHWQPSSLDCHIKQKENFLNLNKIYLKYLIRQYADI